MIERSACLVCVGLFLPEFIIFLVSHVYCVPAVLLPTDQQDKEELKFCGSIILAYVYKILTSQKKQRCQV